jgi:uncharacterized membrane protein
MLKTSGSKPLSSVAEADKWDLLPSVARDEPSSVAEFQHAAGPVFLEESSAYAWEFAGLACLLVASRFAGLTHQSLWYDEGYTVVLSSAASFHEFWLRFGNFTTSEHLQPLYYLLMFLWSRVAGVSDVALRAPSAVFSIASGIAACFVMNSLAGGRRKLILLASTALVVSSFSLYYAQEARPYALLQFLAFLLLAAFLRIRAADEVSAASLASWIGFGITCSLCFLGSPFTALLVLCLAASDLAVTRGWKRWLRVWALPAVISVVSFLGYLIPALKTMPSFIAQDVTAIKQPLWMNVVYAIYGIVFGTTLRPEPSLLRGPEKLYAILENLPIVLPAAVTLVLLAAGVYLLIRKARSLSRLVTILLSSLGIYFFALFGLFGEVGRLNVLPRHASALFVLLFVGVAAVGALAAESTSSAGKTLFYLGIGGWFVLNLVSITGYFSDPAFRKDDYRAAAAALSGYTVPTFIVAGQPQLLARYGADTRDATKIDPDQLAKFITTNSGHAAEVVLVFNQFRNYRWESSSLDLTEAMAPDYGCQNVKHVSNIDLYVCHYLPSKQVTSSG